VSAVPPLRLELSPCPALAGAILAAHAAAAGCVLLAVPGAAGAALAFLLGALGAAAAWNRALLRGSRAPRAIELGASGEARLVRADGSAERARPVGGAGVARGWVALRLGGRGGILITAGMLGSEPLRRLRVWALWGRAPGVARGQLQG
jgi:hypothetical protein